MKKLKSPSDLENFRKNILSKKNPKKKIISVCVSTGCEALGVQKVLETFNDELKNQGLEGNVEIKGTGCLGFCEKGPRLVIYPEEIYYFQVKPSDVSDIVSKTLINNQIVENLLYSDPVTGKRARYLSDVPFYKYQNRILLESNSKLNPKEIEDYLAIGGYSALSKVLFQIKGERRRRFSNTHKMAINSKCTR